MKQRNLPAMTPARIMRDVYADPYDFLQIRDGWLSTHRLAVRTEHATMAAFRRHYHCEEDGRYVVERSALIRSPEPLANLGAIIGNATDGDELQLVMRGSEALCTRHRNGQGDPFVVQLLTSGTRDFGIDVRYLDHVADPECWTPPSGTRYSRIRMVAPDARRIAFVADVEELHIDTTRPGFPSRTMTPAAPRLLAVVAAVQLGAARR